MPARATADRTRGPNALCPEWLRQLPRRGDGPVSATLDPRPRDFRDASAFKSGFDVQAIAATVANGLLVDAPTARGHAGTPGHRQGMPTFEHLSDLERQSLALYVIALRSESQ
jgi:hypothetical protein